MKVIQEGSEHSFLNFIEKLKVNPSGWIACTFPFSRKLKHEELVVRRAYLKSDLSRLNADAQAFISSFQDEAASLPGAHLFCFRDHDVILLCCPTTEEEQKKTRIILEKAASAFSADFCDYGFLTKELYVYQKIADQKLLSERKMEAYEQLTNDSMIESIALRRRKREEPLILIVEDDRFTASYINGFLKDFDIAIARTGEEAILKYIEYAPDAVFMDIHLPGLNGHQALQAIKAADPEAFVVMLSVDTARSSIVNASQNGAVSFLKKPFTRERVLNTLRLSPFIRDSRGLLPVQRS